MVDTNRKLSLHMKINVNLDLRNDNYKRMHLLLRQYMYFTTSPCRHIFLLRTLISLHFIYLFYVHMAYQSTCADIRTQIVKIIFLLLPCGF